MTKYRTFVMIVNSRIIDKAFRKAIRVINAQTVELNYITLKYLEYYNLIDIEARNMFKKGLSLLVLKCCYSFNMYGIRDDIINAEKTNILCPKCNQIESQEHIIQYNYINNQQILL